MNRGKLSPAGPHEVDSASITITLRLDIHPHNDYRDSPDISCSWDHHSKGLSNRSQPELLRNNEKARRLHTHAPCHITKLTLGISLAVRASFLVQGCMQGVEVIRVDGRAVVYVEVRSDTSTGRETSYRSTSEILIKYGAKCTAMHHGWPSFDAGAKCHDANDLLILVVPEYFLSVHETG